MKLESIEHAKFRALAQITIDKEKGIEAFNEYMKIAFPYLEATRLRDSEQMRAVLEREVARGPLQVQALPQQKVRSRLKTKIIDRYTPEAKRIYERISERSYLQ